VTFLALQFDTGDADAWSDALIEAGALSIDIADPGAGTPDESPLYGEPGWRSGEIWQVSRVTALFPAGADPQAAMLEAGAMLGITLPRCETYAVADQDWVRATRAQFAPIRISERLWIVPSWCEAPDPGAINIKLDPGLAFGTGTHPTTRLCLEWLACEIEAGASVLDFGCGSGILAIAASMLGAGRVVGTDIDPLAIEASRANAAANHIAATFLPPDRPPDDDRSSFDIVIANILAKPLLPLAPVLAARVRAGGRILLSGILADQAAEVAATYARWFIIAVWKTGDDGWVALAGTRRGFEPAP
jgi:ribosomal protein L11 methyltransferase